MLWLLTGSVIEKINLRLLLRSLQLSFRVKSQSYREVYIDPPG